MAENDTSKAPRVSESSSGQFQFATEQWIIQAFNNLREDISNVRVAVEALSDRIRRLEGAVKYVGGFISALMFVGGAIFILDRLGYVISFTPKP